MYETTEAAAAAAAGVFNTTVCVNKFVCFSDATHHQSHDASQSPLDTPSYQLLVKPCLPYKLFLFFTLLFEKAAF